MYITMATIHITSHTHTHSPTHTRTHTHAHTLTHTHTHTHTHTCTHACMHARTHTHVRQLNDIQKSTHLQTSAEMLFKQITYPILLPPIHLLYSLPLPFYLHPTCNTLFPPPPLAPASLSPSLLSSHVFFFWGVKSSSLYFETQWLLCFSLEYNSFGLALYPIFTLFPRFTNISGVSLPSSLLLACVSSCKQFICYFVSSSSSSSSSFSAFQALGFTIFGEIFGYVTIF